MIKLSRWNLAGGKSALVLNCGSSSVKYQFFRDDKAILKGNIENIGLPQCTHSTSNGGEVLGQGFGFSDSIKLAINSVMDKSDGSIDCIGHRVVHGGPLLTKPTIVTTNVMDEIKRCSSLAPLHNPSNLSGIQIASSILPTVPQVACFDTAFHASLPPRAYRYALPNDLVNSLRIRRYGFHGLSYSYISSVVDHSRIIVTHLGSGCSAASIVDKQSVDTTMGLTPMEGLVMSTRSGSIDPGVLLYLLRETGGSVEDISNIINKKSGLLGLSGGISSDMKELLRLAKSADPRQDDAKAAVDVFVYTVQKFIGQLMASLEFSVDAIVFTGGIGENSAEIRARVMSGFDNLGVRIDASRNESVPSNGYISAEGSSIPVLAVKTNEELQIARDAVAAAVD